MSIQTAAKGIMVDSEYKNAVSYIIACACCCDQHLVHAWVEIDGKDEVILTFYVNTTTPYWKKGFSRIKAAWDILINGYREEQHVLLLERDSALNVAHAIKQTVLKLDKLKESK